MLKKTLLATSVLVACSGSAFAEVSFKANDKTTMTVGGGLTAAHSSVQQDGIFQKLNSANDVSNDLKSDRMAVSANLSFDINFKPDDANNYGFYTKLNTNTSTTTASGNTENADKVMIYLENTKIGRLEAGSYDGAFKKIKVAPADLAVATGGVDGDFSDYFANGAFKQRAALIYDNVSGAFYTAVNLPGDDAKRANKLTYYTPSYKGFSAGFSFIPDTDHQGTIFGSKNADVTKKGLGYTNVIVAAAKYEGRVKDVDYAFSVIGNFGQAKTYTEGAGAGAGGPKTFKRNDLAAVEIGGQVGFKGAKFAAAYGHMGKSGGMKSITNAGVGDLLNDFLTGAPSTSYYSFGAAYDYEKFGFSATYYNSSALGLLAKTQTNGVIAVMDRDGKKNKFESFSFGVEYKIFDNLKAFAEYTQFKYSKENGDNVLVAPAAAPVDDRVSLNKGHVALIGLKAKF